MEEKIMEEKTVKMEPNVLRETPEEAPTKLSYDELENIAKQLSDQNRQLYQKLQETTTESMFKRLDFLFKVLEFNSSFDQAFTDKCVEEIQYMITIPEQESEDIQEESQEEN